MSKRKILEVKPFQETLHGSYCGPASLKMVLAYYGVDKEEEEIALQCGRDPELGVDDVSIKKVAESYGFEVEIKNEASFEDIRAWLDKKVPVIVNWFSWGRADYSDSEVADGHYSVVVGLDEENIYLQDPEIGELRTIAHDDFMRVWFDFTGEYVDSWEDMIVRQLIAVWKV